MHKFWYHSPVRFYRTLEELQDMTNPQNTGYFGEKKPYPLEFSYFHRFLVPNVDNSVTDTNLQIYCVSGLEIHRIVSVCEIVDGKLKYVTFKSKKPISGRLEIRNSMGETLFYSNCVSFIDSTDSEGRKHIRIATKHTYNRGLFDFQSPLNWIVTSIPAYCLGMTDVAAEVSNSRIGGNNTLKVKETYLDEVVSYQILANGDANLINFLQVHVTNNYFYIDGTQRTCLEKIDRDEFSMLGKIRFTNVKEKGTGLNASVTFDDLLTDIFTYVLGNESKTIVYSHNNKTLIGWK